jgi:hypothetical protein
MGGAEARAPPVTVINRQKKKGAVGFPAGGQLSGAATGKTALTSIRQPLAPEVGLVARSDLSNFAACGGR